jgi:AraC-like DNA-binding protein
MSDLAEIFHDFSLIDGDATETYLKGVRLFKNSKTIARRPMLYDPGICIVAAGHKKGYLGEKTFRYDPENYLVTSVSMPFECETNPSADSPLLGLYIDIDLAQLNEIISQMNLENRIDEIKNGHFQLAIGPATLDEEMKDAVVKLLKALKSETEAKILGPGIVKEIYYRALCGKQAPVLFSLARGSGSFSQVARVISMMQGEFSKKFDVEQLATTANMSVSAFHKAFKEITEDSPLQYLKKIRLARARDLIVQKKMKAYLAADAVGYESSSQFSREFKRHFGQSPTEVMKTN